MTLGRTGRRVPIQPRLYGGGGLKSTNTIVIFATAGTQTWVAPPGVTQVTVECWGGGAGAISATNAGGGGGGGEYARQIVTVTPGNSYAPVVGAGGAGSIAPPTGAGDNSTFAADLGVTVTANGAPAGPTATSAGGFGGTGSTNTVHFDGGPGGTGPTSGGGGGGGSGGSASVGGTGANGTTLGGAGAAAVTDGGPGGNGGDNGVNGNTPASGPGGGGGGGGLTHTGGAGFAGQVKLTYVAVVVKTITAISGSSSTTIPSITSAALDNFNTGATQLLTARSGWSSVATFNTGDLSLQTDAGPTYAGSANTPATEHSNVWATQFAADQESWFTYGPLGVDNVTLIARGDRLNASGVTQSYEFQVTWNGVGCKLSRQFTTLNSVTLAAPVAGDSFAIQCVGNLITGWRKLSGGSWVQVLSATDSTYSSAGYVGFMMFANGPTSATDFGGGVAGSVVGVTTVINSTGVANIGKIQTITAVSNSTSTTIAKLTRRSSFPISFPTTPVLDDFNTGAVQNLTSRAGWGTTPFYSTEPTLATDATPTYAVGTAAAWRSNWWNSTLTDCEVWTPLGSLVGGFVSPLTRGSGTNTTTPSGYFVQWSITGAWTLYVLNAGVSTSLGVSGTQALSSGDSVGLSSVGTTHTVYYKAAAGAWTALGSAVDATWTSGVLAVETFATERIDSFGGGAFTGRSMIAISSGTSSGRCTFTAGVTTKLITAVSTNTTSGATATLVRNRPLKVVGVSSYGAAIATLTRTRSLKIIGVSSDGAALVNVTRTRSLTALSSGAIQSGNVALVREIRIIIDVSNGASFAYAALIRNHKLISVSSGTTSGGVIKLVRSRALYASSASNNSTGVANVVKLSNAIIAVSTGSSTGIAKSLTRTRVVIGVSSGISTGAATLARARKLIAISSGTSSGRCTFTAGVSKTLVCMSSGTSSGIAKLTRNRIFAVSQGEFVLGGFLLGSSNSSGNAYLNVAPETIIAVSKSNTSSGRLNVTRKRTFAVAQGLFVLGNYRLGSSNSSGNAYLIVAPETITAVSRGSSTALVALVRNRKFSAISFKGLGEFSLGVDQIGDNTSSGIVNVTVAHSGKITAVSNSTSGATAKLVRARKLAALSTTTNSGGAALAIRTRRFGAISFKGLGDFALGVDQIGDNTSSGIATLSIVHVGVKLLTCVSNNGTSSGVAGLRRIRTCASVSTGSSTGLCTTIRARKLTALSTSSSSSQATCTRLRTNSAFSFGASSGIVTTTRTRTLQAISAGTSSGLTTITKTRSFAALSIGSSTGITLLVRSRALKSISTATSTGVAGPILSSVLVIATSTGVSSGILVVNRVRVFAAISRTSTSSGTCSVTTGAGVRAYLGSGASTGIVTLVRTHTFSAVSTGSSTGLATTTRVRATKAFAVGTSSGIVTTIRTRVLVARATGTSTGAVTLIRAHALIAVSLASSSGNCTVGGTAGARSYQGTGSSTGAASFIRVRRLTAVSANSSAAQVALSRARSFACTSTSNSTGILSLGRTRRLTSFSVGTSTGLLGIVRIRTFASVSTGASSGRCIVGDTHALTCLTSGTSSGRITLTRTRALSAVSLSSGSTTCALVRNHAFSALSNNTSTGFCLFTRTKSTTCVSNSTSTGQTGIARARSFLARSTSSSTGMWLSFGVKTVACISNNTSTGKTAIVRVRQTSAVSSPALSLAICKISRTRASASTSTAGTSSGRCYFTFTHGLHAQSQASSTSYLRIFRSRQLHSNSTGGSSGRVTITDLNQYGTVLIYDKNTFNMNITDSTLANPITQTQSVIVIWDMLVSTTMSSDNGVSIIVSDK